MKDLIIDCFAGGGGASVGIEMALGRPVDIAINHDPDAILMHKTNHPDTLHLTEDIFLRMLKPEELKLMQGFPKDYIIDRDYNWKPYPVAKQVARIGNSVVPIMAQKLVEVNCPYLKVGERVPNFRTEEEETGQIRFA